MKILITGAAGFVGRNLCAALRALSPAPQVLECRRDTPPEVLDAMCAACDFVFHLAGVNRPHDPAEFLIVNRDFTALLLERLRGRPCPVMLASSVQAELDNPYGCSKRAAEELVFAYGRETGAPVYVYRLPNLFGKWCRPNYNSVVATFCHNAARGLPLPVADPEKTLEMCYIDDVVEELLRALLGQPTPGKSGFCTVPVTHSVAVGMLAERIASFPALRKELGVPRLDDSLTKKLYATYLAHLPAEGMIRDLTCHRDHRGSFAEVLRTPDRGQVSVSITKPGCTRGGHWHHTKPEAFLVVQGRALIRMRPAGGGEVLEIEVSGDHPQLVDMIPGSTHSIANLSDTEDLVTLIWAGEPFDPARSDTYPQEV